MANKHVQITQSYKEIIEDRQYGFIYYISIIAIIAVVVDSLINIWNQRGLEDLPALFMIGFSFVYILILTRQRKLHTAATFFISMCVVALFYGAYADIDGTWGLFFFLLFPLIASFLFGKRVGMRWISFMAVLLFVALLLRAGGILRLPYSGDAVRNFCLCFTLTTFMIYFYQELFEVSEKIIATRDQQLAKERDQAKAVVTSIGEGLFVIDSQNRVISINPATETLLGLPGEQLLNQPITSVFTLRKGSKLLPKSDYPVLKSLESGKAITINLDDNIVCQSHTGRKFPVSLVASPILAEGKTSGMVIAFRDISTDKQAAEFIEREVKARTQEVHEGEDRLLASINSLDVGYIMTNHQPAIVLSNHMAMSILAKAKLIDGIPLQIRTEHPFSLQDLDKQLGLEINLLEKVQACLAHKKTIRIDSLVYNDIFLELSITPIVSNRGVIGTVILLQDITEERVLERSKDELFTIASHELRTPLTAIRVYSSLIQKNYARTAKDKKLIDMVKGIHGSAIRLIDIVNDFLDTSRLEQKRIDFHYTTFRLEDLVKEVVEELTDLAKEKKLKLNVKKSEVSLSLVYADQERTKQIVINLLGNAIKFTEKGSITISFFLKDHKEGIRMTDTGKGIFAANQTLLFRKFQQAGQDIITRDASRGTGLGLYICKLLTESMNGEIWLEKSEVGKGSTFAFTLPTAQESPTKQTASLVKK